MSRASIVGMLVAAEILIVGMALYTLRGSAPAFGASVHGIDFTAAATAPIAAGATPHVVIDDRESRVRVGVSSDNLVHVRDLTQFRGAIFSSSSKYPQLRVTRTGDGVLIERPQAGSVSMDIFGYSTQTIEVDVPSGSRLEIARCSGAEVTGIAGGVSVRSQDGSVKLADLQGTIDVASDDGSLRANNLQADTLTLETRDGRIEADGVSVAGAHPQATLHSGDGSVHASGTFAAGGTYELSSDDGSIELRLARDADLTIAASTGDGRILVDGNAAETDDSSQRTIRLGAGSSTMKLATSDGSIRILTNGASVQ